MGYYDALSDINYSYLHLINEFQFDPGIYASWRHFLEVTNLDNWKNYKDSFSSFDDFISFCILDWAFHIQDENTSKQSVELASQMIRCDSKLLQYCQSLIEHDGIICILKNHPAIKNIDFLKESILRAAY